MCQFCRLTNGDIGVPIIDLTKKFGEESANLSVWVKNDDERGIHQLMGDVDFFGKTLIDGTVDINYCPVCGRNLKVE